MNTFQKFISLYKIDVRSKTEIGVGFLWYHCRATGENATDSRLLLKYYAAAETEAPTLKELEESFANRRNGVVKAAGAHRFRIKQGYERYFNEQFEIPVFESDLPLYIEGRITDAELIAEIDAQSALMIAVATGDASIQDMNEAYRQRRERLQEELSRRGIEDPNPYGDLRRWYGKWSSGDLPSYQSRCDRFSLCITVGWNGAPEMGLAQPPALIGNRSTHIRFRVSSLSMP
jgi:hypothetical protein